MIKKSLKERFYKKYQANLITINYTRLNMQNPSQEEIDRIRTLIIDKEFLIVEQRIKSFIKKYPKSFILWNMLGVVAYETGKLGDSITAYKKSISINPNYAFAYNNLGLALKNQGNQDEVINSFKKAISLEPDFVDAYNNMAVILSKQGKFDEAIALCKKAISIQPDFPEAFNNMGAIYREQGNLNESLLAIKKSKSLKPDYADAYNNLGTVLRDQGDFKEAIKVFKKAISLQPDHTESYNNLGVSLSDQGRIDESIEAHKKAILLKPNFEMARTSKIYQQAQICDWKGIRDERNWIPKLGIGKQAIRPFHLLSIEDSPLRHKKRAENYNKNKVTDKISLFNTKEIESHKPIKIGYFSSDFKEHPTAYLIAKVIEIHNREEFKVYGYSIKGTRKDRLYNRLVNAFDEFKDLSEVSDKEAALIAREDNIDIAIDLNGYTRNSRTRIFAYRAAPTQINYLGYPGTLGTNFMDYIIADPIIIPAEFRNFYSENIIYMPHTYQPTDDTRAISQKKITRSDIGLPENSFVFCCFNNNCKITSEEFNIWMRIMKKIKDSVLWLFKSNQWAESNLKKEAQNRGVNANRIIFADRLPQDEHLARHKLADLFIDTFNYNAHTTASDALWAGLPVVTKMGKGFSTRVAGSLLNSIDLCELITDNKKIYEKLIIDLATNPNKLNEIKEKLNRNRFSKPLFNTVLYTKNLENGYKRAHELYLEKKKTRAIYI